VQFNSDFGYIRYRVDVSVWNSQYVKGVTSLHRSCFIYAALCSTYSDNFMRLTSACLEVKQCDSLALCSSCSRAFKSLPVLLLPRQHYFSGHILELSN